MRKGGDELIDLSEFDSPAINGMSVRYRWSSLEPEPGKYDWRLLEKAHDIAVSKKLWMMITVSGGMFTPEWVYALGPRKITFLADDTNWMEPNTTATMPVVWDEPYVQAWENLLKVLGEKIRDLPEVHSVCVTGAGFISEMHLPKRHPQTAAQWEAVGIDDEKMVVLYKRLIATYDRVMPRHIGLPIHLGSPFGQSKTADIIYAWALQEYPGRVWFQQDGLQGGTQADGRWSRMLRNASSLTTVGYEMLGSVTRNNEETGDRRKAFERAIEDGCTYVEIFRDDLLVPEHKEAIEFLAEGLKRNAGGRLVRNATRP